MKKSEASLTLINTTTKKESKFVDLANQNPGGKDPFNDMMTFLGYTEVSPFSERIVGWMD